MSIELLLTALIVVATPGTGVLYTLAVGLARGTRARGYWRKCAASSPARSSRWA